ncbi:hypothetical protein AB685_00480 [Bacillus sp. LL01]|uniref:hypothetical protein n=1 Tax=Bacillus sp. LL01 TaxID=1665556 RepID=UPI00064D0D8A|nr:hypothetical protein [Bacillus sp. LL01]KMJ59401.1 hypothetical protein AB685_00480 [Bacillus sp. LL01]
METVKIDISAIDNFSNIFKDLESKTSGIGGKLESLSGGMKDVGGKMSKWVTGPMAAAGAGLFGLATATGNHADRLLDLRDITGMSTDTLQEWGHVANIAGVDAESVAHATEGLIRRLPQLEAEGGKATEGLSKLGLSFSDLEKMTPDDMIDTLVSSLAGMDDPLERNAIGSQLFGGAWKDMAPILGMGVDQIDALKAEAHDLGGVLDEDALNAANEFRQSMVRLQTQAMALARDIGAKVAPIFTDVLVPAFQEHVAPALAKVGEFILNLIEWFKGLSPEGQKTTLMILGIVAAIGPMLVIGGHLITVVMNIAKVVGVLGKALLFLTTNPIGLTILAIAALVAAGIWLYNNWDTVKAKAEEIWGALKAFMAVIFAKIEEVVKKAATFVSKIIDEKFGAAGEFIKKYLNLAWENVKVIFEYIKSTIGNATDFLKALVKGDFEGMKDAISNQLEDAKKAIEKIWGNIQKFFEDIDLKQVGKDIIQGLINGIGAMATKAAEKALEVASAVKKTITGFFGVKSPARVMIDIGGDIGEGLNIGIGNATKSLVKTTKSFSDATMGGFQFNEPAIAGSMSSARGGANSGVVNNNNSTQNITVNLEYRGDADEGNLYKMVDFIERELATRIQFKDRVHGVR